MKENKEFCTTKRFWENTHTHSPPSKKERPYECYLPFLGHLPSGLVVQKPWVFGKVFATPYHHQNLQVPRRLMIKSIFLDQFTNQNAPDETKMKLSCYLHSFLFSFLYFYLRRRDTIKNETGQLKFKTLKPATGLVHENKPISQRDQTQNFFKVARLLGTI